MSKISSKQKAEEQTSAESQDSRRLLLKAAQILFAQKGFDGTTVREIADSAGVNLSLVSYHFNGKEGLYCACIEQFGRERLAAARRTLQPATTLEEFRVRLKMVLGEVFSVHFDQPDICTIVYREAEAHNPVAAHVFEQTFLEIFKAMVEFFKSAQKAKVINDNVEPMFLAQLVQAIFHSFVQMDEARKRYFGKTLADPKYRQKMVDETVQVILNGVTNK